jgi:catechol 2,3-dioxygenase-like lactoylglutathione lyase family enzyme
MFEPKGIMPVLRVSDMNRSVQFYSGILGFTMAWRNQGDGDGEVCLLQWGNAELLLSTGSYLGDSPKFTGTLYFNGEGVAELYERVKDRLSLVWPLSEMEYGTREFGVHDPDGYVLAFAQSLPGPELGVEGRLGETRRRRTRG